MKALVMLGSNAIEIEAPTVQLLLLKVEGLALAAEIVAASGKCDCGTCSQLRDDFAAMQAREVTAAEMARVESFDPHLITPEEIEDALLGL